MAKQIQVFSFSGMQRDMSVSKHPAQFLYDARNIRLTARNSNTLLSITNEQGTAETGIEVQGIYLGHCLLNQYLVVFSTTGKDEASPDYITRIDLSFSWNYNSKVLYNGNLGFNLNNPITAIASFENKHVQKVYWTDELNQPRMINISPEADTTKYNDTYFDFISTLQLKEEVKVKKLLGASGQFAPGVIQYAFTYYRKYGQESSIFYTTPLLYISHKDRGASPEDKVENAFQITVENIDPNFDFLRIYSIHRTSLNATPFCRRVQDIPIVKSGFKMVTGPLTSEDNPFLKISERYDYEQTHKLQIAIGTLNTECYGYLKANYPNLEIETSAGKVTWPLDASDEAVFWVTKNKVTFDGKKAYWVFVSSKIDSTGQLALGMLDSITDSLTFIDNGYSGDTVDPTELLFKGGETIIAKTLEQKDGTLFFGGITLKRKPIEHYLRARVERLTTTDNTRLFKPLEVSSDSYKYDPYKYASQLTANEVIVDTEGNKQLGYATPCSGFKRGDYYRLGLQFQHETGKWSDPIFINNKMDVLQRLKPEEIDDKALGTLIKVPGFETTIGKKLAQDLGELKYKKVRPVVVFPQLQDRVVLCQGVTNPTLYTKNSRGSGDDKNKATNDIYAQASWFFRPYYSGSSNLRDDGTYCPIGGERLVYQSSGVKDDPADIKAVEIQGDFQPDNQFCVDKEFSTFHSPEIELDEGLWVYNFLGVSYQKVGNVKFSRTLSDIDIQTETPTISTAGAGFIHKSFTEDGAFGIGAGLFYDDFIVDDIKKSDDEHPGQPGDLVAWQNELSPVKYLVYPWHRTGSLNNDINRPGDKGVASAILKKKVISNLRYAKTEWETYFRKEESLKTQLFSSDEPTVIKVDGKIYQANVDTLLNPDDVDGVYFAFNSDQDVTLAGPKIQTPFEHDVKWKTFGDKNSKDAYKYCTWFWNGEWDDKDRTEGIGDVYKALVLSKASVRMKYKSSPHLALINDRFIYSSEDYTLPILEIIQPGDTEDSNYRSTMFGGKSQDALEANRWIPCGKPVVLNTEGDTKVLFEYGDTYYQRYDCLKTYAFTPEDINQVVEIGSFMLETHVNIDGRYDRNRGQLSNINMSPRNFNLINPVYSQVDNFFTYRMMDEDYYTINTFPNQITWTKEKMSGAEVDLWTNITLASTYDLDGSKGAVTSLNTWRDKIFCFQVKGVSQILFNSRVQIPTSDNNPIEITNNYKVDGYRYLSEGIGCNDQRQIKETPAAIYFIDSVSNRLFTIGENLADISQSHNMTTWASDNNTERLCYDEVNKDLYQVNAATSLCYSEILGQYSSFMDYGDISLIESYGQRVFTMKDSKLYAMFEGNACEFFGMPKPYSITFISNENPQMDKIFTNMEFRACVEGDGEYDANTGKFTPTLPFDSLETWDEYQRGRTYLKYRDGHNMMVHHDKGNISHLARKFRIWRCDIPRDNMDSLQVNVFTNVFDKTFRFPVRKAHPTDRMRNPWLFIKFTKLAGTIDAPLKGTEIHDMMVTYFT